MTTENKLTYTDHDGVTREVRGCRLTVDTLGRHFIYSDQLRQNLAFSVKGREDALLSAIGLLLFMLELRDRKIAALQRVVNLAEAFAAEAFPPNEEF